MPEVLRNATLSGGGEPNDGIAWKLGEGRRTRFANDGGDWILAPDDAHRTGVPPHIRAADTFRKRAIDKKCLHGIGCYKGVSVWFPTPAHELEHE